MGHRKECYMLFSPSNRCERERGQSLLGKKPWPVTYAYLQGDIRDVVSSAIA